MILDVLTSAPLYRGLPAGLVAGLDFLQHSDLDSLPLGKTAIDGERLFAIVAEYVPKAAALGKFEAHRRYWDVQYVARGAERMGWSTLGRMTVSEPYDPQRDVAFFTGRGDWLLVPAGTFAIFGPSDVHMPGVAVDESNIAGQELVRKIVVKVDLGS